MLFRDYQPYNKKDIKIKSIAESLPSNKKELEIMNRTVDNILKSFTVDNYFKNDFFNLITYIEEIYKSSRLHFKGKVLEFGAGTCKASAVISKYHEITEIHCLDFSEPLLREIAPRVISKVDGDLSKFTFYIGDMNNLQELNEVYDIIICYGSVHHLILPEYFFEQLYSKLKDGGNILCMREPAAPKIIIPAKSLKHWMLKMYQKRLSGENENIYTLDQYKKMVGNKYNFKYVPVLNKNRIKSFILNNIFPFISFKPFQINFVLEKK